jgi:hypothetical protein
VRAQDGKPVPPNKTVQVIPARLLRDLRAKFSTIEDIGPVWAARVAAESGADEEVAKRDAFEQVNQLLDLLRLPKQDQ